MALRRAREKSLSILVRMREEAELDVKEVTQEADVMSLGEKSFGYGSGIGMFALTTHLCRGHRYSSRAKHASRMDEPTRASKAAPRSLSTPLMTYDSANGVSPPPSSSFLSSFIGVIERRDFVRVSASSAPVNRGAGVDNLADTCDAGALFVMNLDISCKLMDPTDEADFNLQGVVTPSIARAMTEEAWNQLFGRKPPIVGWASHTSRGQKRSAFPASAVEEKAAFSMSTLFLSVCAGRRTEKTQIGALS